MKKKMMITSVLAVAVLAITACSLSNPKQGETATASQTPTQGKVINLKSADVTAANSPYTIAMQQYADLMNKDSNGQIQLKHFPAGQLGKDLEIVDGVKLGSIDIGMVGNVSSKVTDALVLPFLFEDAEHMNKVLNGAIGDKLKKKFEEETGLKMIGFASNASRVLTTKGKEVKTPADVKGLKIRVPEIPVYVDTWKALGAIPTPIAFTDLFSALQTGVVMGQENPFEIIANNSFYEVQDTVIETYHAIPPRFLIMNKKKYDSLTPEQQKTLENDWKAASATIEKLYKENDAAYIKTLKDKGMKFVQPDVNAFREATKNIWKKYAPQAWGEGVYEEIQSLRKNK